MKTLSRLAACLAACALLGACSTLGAIDIGDGETITVSLVSERIGAPRTEDGELTREGRLLTAGAVLLTVAEAASYRELGATDRTALAASLRTAGAGILDAQASEGWFIEADLQQSLNVAVEIIGRAAMNRAMGALTSLPTGNDVLEIAETGQTVVNMTAGFRRVSAAYAAGELDEAEVTAILRGRYERALRRLDPE